MPMEGETVYGSIVRLSKEEMILLDTFEGTSVEDPFSKVRKINWYRRVEVPTIEIDTDGKEV